MSCRSLRFVCLMVAVAALGASATPAASILEFVEAKFDGLDGIEALDDPVSLAISPDGKHLYVAGGFDDAVVVFQRNATTGRLAFVEAEVDGVGGVEGLSGAQAVTVSPDGKHVYVASQYSSAVAAFRRDATTGALAFVEAERNGRNGVTGMAGAVALAITADGAHVYVAGRSSNAVAAFSRNPADGTLAFVEAVVDGGGGFDGLEYVESVAVSPDGKHVYAVGLFDSMVASMARDVATGKLTFVETDEVFGSPSWVTVSPDGKNVYVAGSFDIYVYARNAGSGALTLVEEENVSSIDGVGFPDMVVVSPNGEYLYEASLHYDALGVFSRDSASGEITYVERHANSVSGVAGLEGAVAVAVSPDNAFVYVAGRYDHAVAAFWKDFPVGFVDGNEAYFAQDWAAAEQHFSDQLAQDPTSAVLHNNRGLARCKQLDFAGAQADFDAAKSLDPSYVAPYLNQGKCLAMQKAFGGARAEFESGLAIDPDHAKLLFGLGWLDAEEGDWDGAIASYDAALAAEPTYVRAIVAKGVALAEKGENDTAAAAFYAAINGAPTGDLYAAIAAYDLQLLRGPGVAFANATAAQDYLDGLFDMRVGLFDRAVGHLESAQNLASTVPDVPWLLSWCMLRRLDKPAAADAFADARNLMTTLRVTSTEGAQLFVDGMFRGNTPQTVRVFPSRYDVGLRRSEGPKERSVPAYADGTPGGAASVDLTLTKVSKFSLFAPVADTDRDWLGDAWEVATFGDLGQRPADDCDHDGADNLHEYWAQTDPGSPCADNRVYRMRRRVLTGQP